MRNDQAAPRLPAPFTPGTPEDSPEVQALRAEITRLRLAAVTAGPQGQGPAAAVISHAKSTFTVPAGEEGYVHALVTHKQGVPVDHPRVEPYHPEVYRTLAATQGFTAEVLSRPGQAPVTPTIPGNELA